MEVYNINPMYKNLINSRGVKTSFKDKKHKNNWIKALISIFVLALLMMSVGVPVYDGLLAIENNAVPYEFGNIGNLNMKSNTIPSVNMGNMLYYQLIHGHPPSPQALRALINGVLFKYDLGALSGLAIAIVDAIIAGSSVADAVGLVLTGLVSPEVESGILGAILAA